MKKEVLDIKSNKKSEITLQDSVFKHDVNLDVLAQYNRVYSFNQRVGTAKTKNKSEVAGGGAKPWRQKGTGRARQGSTRSPIWVHGGVAHGPMPKSWRLKFPKNMRKLAMVSSLSQKELEGLITVVENFGIEKISTSSFARILKTIGLTGKILFVWKDKNEFLLKSAANIKGVKIVNSAALCAHDILFSKNVLFEKAAILDVSERFKK